MLNGAATLGQWVARGLPEREVRRWGHRYLAVDVTTRLVEPGPGDRVGSVRAVWAVGVDGSRWPWGQAAGPLSSVMLDVVAPGLQRLLPGVLRGEGPGSTEVGVLVAWLRPFQQVAREQAAALASWRERMDPWRCPASRLLTLAAWTGTEPLAGAPVSRRRAWIATHARRRQLQGTPSGVALAVLAATGERVEVRAQVAPPRWVVGHTALGARGCLGALAPWRGVGFRLSRGPTEPDLAAVRACLTAALPLGLVLVAMPASERAA